MSRYPESKNTNTHTIDLFSGIYLQINKAVGMVVSFLIPRNILNRQLADFEEIQTIISSDMHAPAATSQMKDNNSTRFLARKSPRIKSACPASDGETWMEIVVCNTPTGSRSLFYSLTSKQAKWDEPPSGASKIIYKGDVEAIATAQFSTSSASCKSTKKEALNNVTSSKKVSTSNLLSKSSSSKSSIKNEMPTSEGNGKTILSTVKAASSANGNEGRTLPAKEVVASSESSNRRMLPTKQVLTSSEICNNSTLPLVPPKREKERGVKGEKAEKVVPSKQSKRLNDSSCSSVKSPPKKLPTLNSEKKSKPKGNHSFDSKSVKVSSEWDTNIHEDMSKMETTSTQYEQSLEFIKNTIDFQLESMERELLECANKQGQTLSRCVMEERLHPEAEEHVSTESSEKKDKHMAKHSHHRQVVNETEMHKCSKHSDQGDDRQQSIQGEISMQNRLQRMKAQLQAIEHSLLESYSSKSKEQLPNNECPTTKKSSIVLPKEGKLTLLEIARNSCTALSTSKEKITAASPNARDIASTLASVPFQQRRRTLEENRERRLRQAGLISRV